MTEFESYLPSRIRSDGYRGIHLAQHNRLPESKLLIFLSAIHGVNGQNQFSVPPGDDPEPTGRQSGSTKIRRAVSGFEEYYRVIEAILAAGENATFNSLKKNHFPNLEAMGLLSRHMVSDGSHFRAHLTDAAKSILDAGATRKRTVLVGKAMENLIGLKLIEELHALLQKINVLNVYELMLIVSDPSLKLDQKENFIRQYRRLKQIGRLQLHSELKAKCALTMALEKKKKRDWHNWWNESAQIISMLSTVSGFNVYENEHVMLAGAGVRLGFDAARSETVKREAFSWHNLAKKSGWEMHHIYPVQYATCDSDMRLIDSKENLIYIPEKIHDQIPKRENLSVGLEFDSKHVSLFNPVSDSKIPRFDLRIGLDADLKVENLRAMERFNQNLLNSVADN